MNKNKIRILYVLKLLKYGTNKNNPISQSAITKALNTLGIKCDRRSVYRDISNLIEFGYDIQKIKGGGCYFNSPEFNTQEIRLILNGIHNLNIDGKIKINLSNKVKNLVNIFDRSNNF